MTRTDIGFYRRLGLVLEMIRLRFAWLIAVRLERIHDWTVNQDPEKITTVYL